LDNKKIKQVLNAVRSGKMSIPDAMEKMKHMPFEDMTFVKVDHHRHIRQGIPEVVFASGKTDEQVITIAKAMYRKSKSFLITKTTETVFRSLDIPGTEFHSSSSMISVGGKKRKSGYVLVLSAGTSDIPVAEECAVTAAFLGSKVEVVYDVGVKCRETEKSQGYRCCGGHGRSAAFGCWRYGGQAYNRCSDLCRLWYKPWGDDSSLCDVELMRSRNSCHEHRQWVWSRLSGT